MKNFTFINKYNGALTITSETYNDAMDLLVELVKYPSDWYCENEEGEDS
jgi:hypothetical protein